MRKPLKRPIKVRKRWAINPKTKVVENGGIYKRPREKRKIKEIIKFG